jgi:hypothetical protein
MFPSINIPSPSGPLWDCAELSSSISPLSTGVELNVKIPDMPHI